MVPQTPLLAESVVLRPPELADAQPLFEAVRESIATVSPWLPSLASVTDSDAIGTWIETSNEAWMNATDYHFVIADKADGALVGACGLTQINKTHHFANLYYWVRTSRVRRGIASTAARRLARFGIEVLGLGRVEIVVDVANVASRRAAEKAGAVLEGTLRNRLAAHDKSHDALMFSLTPEDFGLESPLRRMAHVNERT